MRKYKELKEVETQAINGGVIVTPIKGLSSTESLNLGMFHQEQLFHGKVLVL
ncbi:hypothetical protein [Enterococcus faecalis]|uniref:hypothetical protein n=1 Tax=Enterococcus faecalis TaxID=1351 RepID=UPI0028B9B02A|nr:hypothetical protein [Enterococcus faecalis]MDT6934938.1 hypothetical protein [Enterococcus faecalis]